MNLLNLSKSHVEPEPQTATNANCVLIVDSSDDSREVLKTALERRGICTLDADRAAEGLDLARKQHPRLIVLDEETLPAEVSGWRTDFESAACHNGGSLVLLGKARRTAGKAQGDHYVAKPYHFAPLVRKIEGLLGS